MRNIANFFIIAIGTILALIYGQKMLIQLMIAFLLWFAALQLKKSACQLTWFRRFVPEKLQSIAGMLLSVPITVIMIIILSQFPATHKAAILLSEKGNLSSHD